MSSRTPWWATVTLAACGWLAACADLSRGPAGPTADASSDEASDGAGAASFASAVHPLLIAACQRCHAEGGEAGDTKLLLTGDVDADDATVVKLVDTATPAASRLLSKAGGNGHGGGAVLTASSPEYQAVLQWIQQGARP